MVHKINNGIKEIQEERGLFNYKPGDILFISFDKNKTNNKFDKKRRNFELLGSFLDYVNGNVAFNLLSRSFEAMREIGVPIYFTKFCAYNIVSISVNIFYVLGYKKPSYVGDFEINESDEEDRIIM
jgi:hypothetical protein